MIKLVIFDMDGTILDTLQDIHDSLNYCLAKGGYPVHDISETKWFVGNGMRKLVERALPEGTNDESVQKVFESFKSYYKAHSDIETKPYNGIIELLNRLHGEGIKLAVASNKGDSAVQKLCHDYFEGLFDVAIGDKEGQRRKPEPDMIDHILKQLNISSDEAVYIGDSDVDIMTAQNSNMPCISVTWGFRNREFLSEHGARYFADSTEEIYNRVIGTVLFDS